MVLACECPECHVVGAVTCPLTMRATRHVFLIAATCVYPCGGRAVLAGPHDFHFTGTEDIANNWVYAHTVGNTIFTLLEHDFRLYVVHFTAATTANSTFGILFNTLQDPPLIHMLRTLRNRATSCSLAAGRFIAKRIRLAWYCTRSSIKLKSGPMAS